MASKPFQPFALASFQRAFAAISIALPMVAFSHLYAQEDVASSSATSAYSDMPEGQPKPVPVENADAADSASMKKYSESIQGSTAGFNMVPIQGGSFLMGSPEGEANRQENEGPQAPVEISPFWMSECEVRWDEFHVFMFKTDIQRRSAESPVYDQDPFADAVSRPTPPYVPMDFEMGVEGFPAISMTQFSAKQYTKWLSMKTGRFYRLPTEAEWEYACRAGTKTAYSFGDDASDLDDFAWSFDNADDTYHKVGQKKPNPWGLYDMHGNVSEWVLDGLDETAYSKHASGTKDPTVWPKELYPRVVRGGSWYDDPERLRSAARRGSSDNWKVQDPQLPKSIWYHTDAPWNGFRIVRPLSPPPLEERAKYWDSGLKSIEEIYVRQRRGGR